MSQFDVHRLKKDKTFVIDCQADLLRELNTRLVVPLIAREQAAPSAHRLNPIFRVADGEYVMATQFAAAIPTREIGEVVTSLRDHAYEISAALDVLISGV
jgi:toxin CcdB